MGGEGGSKCSKHLKAATNDEAKHVAREARDIFQAGPWSHGKGIESP